MLGTSITIKLADYHVTGIKKYLKEVCDIKRPTKKDIHEFLDNELKSMLDSPKTAVSDYIKAAVEEGRAK